MRTTEAIRTEMEARLSGSSIPAFLVPAKAAPAVLDALWHQYLAAELESSLPAILRARLFLVLSRDWVNRYFAITQSCALHSEGVTAPQILGFLQLPFPSPTLVDAATRALAPPAAEPRPAQSGRKWHDAHQGISAAAPTEEESLFICAVHMASAPRDAETARAALLRTLGGAGFAELGSFLGFVRLCQAWTETHPEISPREEVETLRRLELLFGEEPRLRSILEPTSKPREDAAVPRKELMSLLGHELRNCLGPVLTAIELMGMREAGEDTSRERGVVERQVRHMVEVVDDVLALSRIFQGKTVADPQWMDLHFVVEQALGYVRPQLAQRAQKVAPEIPRGLKVEADAQLLSRAISSLVGSISRSIESGLEIALGAARVGDRIVVRARGLGAAAPSGNPGIALLLVQNIVELHGGTMIMRWEGEGRGKERGAEFEISLPAAAPSNTQPSQGSGP